MILFNFKSQVTADSNVVAAVLLKVSALFSGTVFTLLTHAEFWDTGFEKVPQSTPPVFVTCFLRWMLRR